MRANFYIFRTFASWWVSLESGLVEHLYHGNWQMLQVRASSPAPPRELVVRCLLARLNVRHLLRVTVLFCSVWQVQTPRGHSVCSQLVPEPATPDSEPSSKETSEHSGNSALAANWGQGVGTALHGHKDCPFSTRRTEAQRRRGKVEQCLESFLEEQKSLREWKERGI